MSGDAQRQGKADQRDHRSANKTKFALIARNFFHERQDARRPEPPRCVNKHAERGEEKHDLDADKRPPDGRGGCRPQEREQPEPAKADDGECGKHFPASAVTDSRDELLKLRGLVKKGCRARLKHSQTVKHCSEPGGAGESVEDAEAKSKDHHCTPGLRNDMFVRVTWSQTASFFPPQHRKVTYAHERCPTAWVGVLSSHQALRFAQCLPPALPCPDASIKFGEQFTADVGGRRPQ